MSFSQFHPLERHPRTGEPHIRLTAPFDRIVITPPRQDDVPHIVAILNDYAVKKWLDGPPFPYLDMHAEEWIAKTKEQSDAVMHELRVANEEYPTGPSVAVSGCPVGCLRGVEEDGSEVFLGAIEFSRCNFPDLLNQQEQERMVARNDSRKRGDPDIVWCIGYYVAAPLHGRGLMSRAVRTLLEAWVVPRMGARQIRVETVIGNHGSIRVLEKLGFRIVDTVRRRKVTSAGELIDGFHVLYWHLSEGRQP
ncbi:GNAT domain-containing protein [Dichomitus squalens]|uniref:GNAT domain-containing protein n=1 Tax=Dichomitus squalens TaxID=114155 RepID=A0A4Q9N2Q4_9APHY|nr:GNAT domain-containing protein [Dichomitus squalens]